MGTMDKQPSNCCQCTYNIYNRALLLNVPERTSVYICTVQCAHDCKTSGHESNNKLVHLLCFRHALVVLYIDHEMHYTPCTLEHTSAYNSTASLLRRKADITEIFFNIQREHKIITGLQLHVEECLVNDEQSPLLIVFTEHAFEKSITDQPTYTVKVIACLTHYNQLAKGPQNKKYMYLVNVTLIDKTQEKHTLTYDSHLCKKADSKIILAKVMNAVTDKSYLPENVFTEHRKFHNQNYLQRKNMTTLALLSLEIKALIIFQRIFFHDAVFDKSLDSKLINVIKTSVSDNINNATINSTKNTRRNGYCDTSEKQRQLHSCLKRMKKCVKKFNVTLHSLFWTHVLVIISLLSAICCQQDITVTWKMKSNMTIFGKNAELECAISDYINSCNGNLRQWYGGKPYDFLCRNGDCRNNAKYVERKEAMCKYTLTIYNFSINDINCEYTCSYGVHRSRKMLNLDEQHFNYIPSINEVNYTVKVQDTVNATVFIPKVYPSPLCQASFADKKITTMTNISSVGYMYATQIQIVYKPPVDICKGVFNISCKIGSTNFTPVYQNVTVCKGVTDSNSHTVVTVILIVILIILVAATLMAYLYCTKFRKQFRDNRRNNISYTSASERKDNVRFDVPINHGSNSL